MLEDKLNKSMKKKLRPSREDLVSRGVLVEDVMDKVLSLTSDDAKEILLRLALKGGPWATEVERAVRSKLDEEVIDIGN